MKKISLKTNILSTVFCIGLAVSVVPAQAALFDNFPNTVYDYGITRQDAANAFNQIGGSQMHDTDYLKTRYQDSQRENDYKTYEDQKNPGQSVIDNYNNNGFGFQQGTVEELNTNGVHVNNIEVSPSEILTKDEINKIIAPLIGKNVLIEDIQRVIDQINNMYAAKGFVTARAFLPEQTVENGNIYISLTESKIGNISVEENRWTTDGYVKRRMPEKEGQLFDIVELEKDVLDFNRYNDGIRLSANLKAGEKPGTTDIDLIADESFPIHLMGIMDNAGRTTTGSLRGGAMIYVDSLTGHRDKLTVGSYFSKGAQSPFADYNFPVNKSDGRVGFMFSSTFADIIKGNEFMRSIGSNAYQYSLYYSQPLVRKPGFELKSYLAANYKRSRTFTDYKSGFPEYDRLIKDYIEKTDNVTSIEGALQMRKDTKYGIWYLNQDAYYAIPILNSDRDNHFFKYSGSLVRLHDFSHGVIGQLRSNYQIVPKNKAIPYMDQMQTGGLVTVRGYHEGLMIGKNGYFVSGELMFPLLPREITSPRSGEKVPFIGKFVKGAIFADTAGIFPAAKEDYYKGEYFAASVGAGLRVQLPLDLTARLYWGFPLIRNHHEAHSKMGRFHFELTVSPNIDALLASRSTKARPVPATPAPQTTFQKNVEAEYVNNYDDIRHYDYFRDGGGGSL